MKMLIGFFVLIVLLVHTNVFAYDSSDQIKVWITNENGQIQDLQNELKIKQSKLANNQFQNNDEKERLEKDVKYLSQVWIPKEQEKLKSYQEQYALAKQKEDSNAVMVQTRTAKQDTTPCHAALNSFINNQLTSYGQNAYESEEINTLLLRVHNCSDRNCIIKEIWGYEDWARYDKHDRTQVVETQTLEVLLMLSCIEDVNPKLAKAMFDKIASGYFKGSFREEKKYVTNFFLKCKSN